MSGPIAARRPTVVQRHFIAPHTPQTAQRYIYTPDPLIAACANDPLAIGVWTAVARLAWLVQGPMPISAAELAAWMGRPQEPDRVAIMRRIRKLEEDGWLIITRTTAGKHHLLPAWGRDADGTPRPWQFGHDALGRPEHLRGRHVPVALFDHYIGQITPQPDRMPALIARYVSYPLLDLADIGTYAIALRTEIRPTAQLQQLGLITDHGVEPPPSLGAFLAQVVNRHFSVSVGDARLQVKLTAWGATELGVHSAYVDPVSGSRSFGRSNGRSHGRSADSCESDSDRSYPDAENELSSASNARNAWDGWDSKLTNQSESPPNVIDPGGGAVASEEHGSPESQSQTGVPSSAYSYPPTACDEIHQTVPDLSPLIIVGHQGLNRDRTILPGEWWELLALQIAHGTQQLLIWQARADRASCDRPHGIRPEYYWACAAQEIYATYRPPRQEPPRSDASLPSDVPATDSPPPPAPVAVSAPGPRPTLDPACDGLLREMGIREREQLAAVPLALIQQWAAVLDHAGLVARFDDVPAFAHTQLRRGNAPPSVAELERWAHQAQARKAAQPPPPLTPAEEAQILELEARLRARLATIAPPDLTPDERLALMVDLEAGTSDAEALERLAERRAIVPPSFTVEQVAARVVAALNTSMYRPLRPIVGRLELAIDAGGLRLGCRHVADLSIVRTQVLPLIQQVLSLHGWPTDVQVVSVAPLPTPSPAPADAGPPDWIAPAQWAALPPVLRGALVGSTLGTGGELHCVSPALLHCAQTRYARELAALLAAHQEVRDGN